MADTILLEIVTPYRKFLSKEVRELTAPAELGEIGVLPGHTPLVTILRPGELTYRAGGELGRVAIGRGYAEVSEEKAVILVDRAETEAEIDLKDAKDELAKAEEEIKKLTLDDPAYPAAFDTYAIAETRVRIKERGGK